MRCALRRGVESIAAAESAGAKSAPAGPPSALEVGASAVAAVPAFGSVGRSPGSSGRRSRPNWQRSHAAPWLLGFDAGATGVKHASLFETTGDDAMEFTIYHLLIIVAFIGVVVWAFGSKRKKRFEKDAKIPFEDKSR
jgi:cytochrome c oxidase cbb3-type subunit IV